MSTEHLATRARQRRLELGMTQEEVAEVAGIARLTVIETESGKRDSLRSDTVERYAAALRVSPSWLLFGPDKGQHDDRSPTRVILRRNHPQLRPEDLDAVERHIQALEQLQRRELEDNASPGGTS